MRRERRLADLTAGLIDVPAGVDIPEPILVVHWCESAEGAAAGTAVLPRTCSRLGDGARVAVVEV